MAQLMTLRKREWSLQAAPWQLVHNWSMVSNWKMEYGLAYDWFMITGKMGRVILTAGRRLVK